MTEDLIAMAKQAGDTTTDVRGRETFSFDEYGIAAFAALIEASAVARTREECAKLADDMDFSPNGDIGSAIRALGERT